MSLKQIAFGTALLTGFSGCGNLEIMNPRQNHDEVDNSYECYVPDENGKPVPRDFSPDYVCIKKYLVEIPALPYLAELQKMHPGMSTSDVLEMVNNGKKNMDFIIRATEITPYAVKEKNNKLAENK